MSPIFPNARSSACARTEQVFRRMTSASSSRATTAYPWAASMPRISSESRSFIWQPYVWR